MSHFCFAIRFWRFLFAPTERVLHEELIFATFSLLFITILMFGDVLFAGGERILSQRGLDLYSGEMSGLEFLFREMRNGNLPLWNPHIFGGTPIFQTPLYPPHLLNLFLPLPAAINWEIALHTFLLGIFLYLWVASYSKIPFVRFAVSVAVMFSGQFFMHIYAGHLTNLCAMTWIPLIFLAIDSIMNQNRESTKGKWALVGATATAMQIMVGQFQYVYYTAVISCLYCIVKAPGFLKEAISEETPLLRNKRIIYTLIWLASIPIGASCLAAFFLFPVLSTLQEMVRANGVDFKFASHFSFPPENLITLIAPFFHGDMINLPYWGRCYLWEMNLFFGISTLFFALWGATIKGRGRILTIMVVLSILLALGAHTPIFRILFDYLPGFSNFRGSSKFMFFTTLFLSLLASIGLDRLFQLKNFPRVMKLLFICGALSCSVVAGFLLDINSESLLNKWSGELWQKYLRFIAETSESYLPSHLFFREEFAVITANFAAIKLLWASVIFFLGALSVSLSVHRKSAIYLFVCLVVLEPLVFAKQMRPTFHYQDTLISVFARFHAAHQGDYRIFSSVAPNNALSVGSYDIWGYGPFALKRYCEFMASTQEKDPLKITSTYIDIRKFPSIMSMLRLRYIFTIQNGLISIAENSDYLSLGQIIHDWKIIETKEERLKEMLQQDFSPRALVILEKPPSFGHSSKTGNKNIAEYCTLQRISSDEIEVRAVLSRPGICLITENFSRGWRITPLPGEGTLLNYEIHPANHTLMAVPLSAGYHAFRLEYQPRCFVVGSLVSMMSLCFLVMIILYLVKSINGKHRFSRTV